MVNASVEAVQRAGLQPVMVDLSSFAILRSMAATDDLGLGAPSEALVDVGATVTNIVVHQGGVPRFVRILMLGGQDVTVAVAQRMGVAVEEAESLKQQAAVAPAAPGSPVETAARIVENTGTQFVEEVRRSLDYYVASPGAAPLSRLVLTGGGARLGGLSDRLSASTQLPVVLGSPMDRLHIGATDLTDAQLDFVAPLAAVPVGLALGAA
jgi:type IV pilus assembly protein PilM